MTAAFCSFNYPSYLFSNNTNDKHSKNYAARKNPDLANPPPQYSSVFFQAGGSSNSHGPKKLHAVSTPSTISDLGGSLLTHDNTIGIIGGECVCSTLSFLNKLVESSSKDGQISPPPFILCSDPVVATTNSSFTRSSPSSVSSNNEKFQVDYAPTVKDLRHKRVFLEKAGARCIVMPCHTYHLWYDEVSSGCSVPFLHVGECVARELKEANLRPIEAGSPPRIGVLATDAVPLTGFYQEKLWNEGFEVVLPDKATTEHTIIPAIEALRRRDMEGARNLVRIALQILLIRAVNTVILASDDVLKLLPEDDFVLKKCVDPMDALARSALNWAQNHLTNGDQRHTENARPPDLS